MNRLRSWGFESFMIVVAAVFFLPLYYLLVTTFKSAREATERPFGLPASWNFSAYRNAWHDMHYPNAFLNTIGLTVFAVLGLTVLGSMAAYALARRDGKAYRWTALLFLAGLMIPFQLSIVPLFKLADALNLVNTLTGTGIFILCANLSFTVYLIRGFVSTIPVELEEQAFVDGCSVFRTFWQITFPLLAPVIATLAILNAITVWNDFLTPLLFLQSRSKAVILLEVYRNVGQFSVNWTGLFPMLVLGVAPLFAFFLLMQKYVVKGMTTGAVKF